ncbi:MAG TPA: glycerophosphoryl diester phosphodiesterase membrane domain-containing protein [Candidatus Saccharimonadales bacterium]|jgi:hypothetical protein|nr:glycerophosphoryl diester phosphodiesterase membrane domain-containing protein [Candidatus Saccharimonadales bacterium]
MDLSLRPMSTSQVLDKTFGLYRENFLLFAGIAVLPPACVLVFNFLTLGFSNAMTGSPAAALAAVAVIALAGLGVTVLWLMGYALASGASAYAVSRFYLGYGTTIGEAYRLMKPYFLRVVGIILLFSVVMAIAGIALGIVLVICVVVLSIGLGVSVGFGAKSAAAAPIALIVMIIVLLIPVVVVLLYLWAIFAFSVPACVLEKLGVLESMQRSMALTQGARWRLVLVYVLWIVLSLVVSAALSIPYYIGLARMIATSNPAVLRPYLIWQYLSQFVAGSFSFPIVTIAVCLLYYDQRVRKEAFDLQFMMEMVGNQPSTPATSTAQPPAASIPPALG